jgi:hypothetical protein
MACAFQQQANGHLDRHIIIYDQYSCQSKMFSVSGWNQASGGLRILPHHHAAATASPTGTLRSAVKKPG